MPQPTPNYTWIETPSFSEEEVESLRQAHRRMREGEWGNSTDSRMEDYYNWVRRTRAQQDAQPTHSRMDERELRWHMLYDHLPWEPYERCERAVDEYGYLIGVHANDHSNAGVETLMRRHRHSWGGTDYHPTARVPLMDEAEREALEEWIAEGAVVPPPVDGEFEDFETFDDLDDLL